MPSSSTYQWAEETLGEHVQYPGHPVVIACMVMDRYASLAEAMDKPDGQTYGNALADSFLPGSGCAVYAGLELLSAAAKTTLEDGLALATRYWEGYAEQGNSQEHAEKVARGLKQAEHLLPRLRSRFAQWGTDEDLGSVYRLKLSEEVAA